MPQKLLNPRECMLNSHKVTDSVTVFNSLSWERQELIESTRRFNSSHRSRLRVDDGRNKVPRQNLSPNVIPL